MDRPGNAENRDSQAIRSGHPIHLFRVMRAAGLFSMILFGAGTGVFAYAGTFSRYWADDYCYSSVLQQNGFFGGLVSWYQSSGNRFSTLIPVAFSELFGRSAISFIPAAVLILWVAAWMFFLSHLSRALGWKLAWYWTALLALVEVYFIALLAPDRLQTIYWRMGTLHYTLPLPLLLITLGWIAGGFQKRYRRGYGIRLALLAGFLAFFAAGLSETFAAFQTGLFGPCLLACIFFLQGALRRQQAGLFAAGLAGSVLAMVLMVLSPSNALRQAALPPPDNLLLIVPYALRYAVDFVVYAVRGQIVTFLVFLGALLALVMLAFSREKVFSGEKAFSIEKAFSLENGHLSRRGALLGAAVSLPVAYLLIVCSFAPSAFAGLQYPAERAMMPAAFILLVGLSSAVFFAAQLIRSVVSLKPVWIMGAAVILLLAASLYPLRMVKVQGGDIAQLSVRAGRWDARNAEIVSAIQAGRLDVQVQQVDVVQGLEDLDPDPTFWVNRCAVIFYRLNSMKVNP